MLEVDYKSREITLCDQSKMNLQLWDTAGQEQYRTITQSYYRGSHGVVLAYDITNKQSFTNLSHWFKEVSSYARKDIKCVLVGCKSDMDEYREVSTEEAKELADKRGFPFFETSSKDDENVSEAFFCLGEEVAGLADKTKTTEDPINFPVFAAHKKENVVDL
eukprot:CAMPEP_0174260734 /NCGR_PEP_ID=MMETSP0439-20130205/10405_1 /TAXON_ID=0 /ORGANISM="Stereomyxa ramosa, Strain Chinc5" /LENGTH=161 /DNA_ID=CAMNT_0015345047 /DNA_START=164 /DNA_END=646 /DNA_ORIENTATION=+